MYTIKQDYSGYIIDNSPNYKTFDKAMNVLNKTIRKIVKDTLRQGYDISVEHVCTEEYDDNTGYGYNAIRIVANTKVIYFITNI